MSSVVIKQTPRRVSALADLDPAELFAMTNDPATVYIRAFHGEMSDSISCMNLITGKILTLDRGRGVVPLSGTLTVSEV